MFDLGPGTTQQCIVSSGMEEDNIGDHSGNDGHLEASISPLKLSSS